MLEELIDHFLIYLQQVRRYSVHTTTAYRNDLQQFVAYLDKSYEVAQVVEIKPLMARGFVVSLSELDVEAKSINRKISSIKSFVKYLMRNGHIEIDFMEKVTSPKIKKRLPQFVKEEDLLARLNDLILEDNHTNVRDRLIFRMFYVTGMRRAELINLKVSDVDLFQKRIRILGKGNKERFVPLDTKTINLIDEYKSYRSEIKIGSEYDFLFV